jgi:ATP-binding protein involved in chromosome partitioning
VSSPGVPTNDARVPTNDALVPTNDALVPTNDALLDALRGVIDPELGDNIVDLGMVRGASVDSSGRVDVEVALTVASCPLRGQINDDVNARLGAIPGVTSVEVRTGTMNAEEKAALMDRARRKAQVDKAAVVDFPTTARVVAIASGKGGVGKSSVTVNLAVALARLGFVVGLLDADIAGFSVPRMLGLGGQLRGDESRKMLPMEQPAGDGLLKVVSMGFLADEESAIMWRGLVLNRALQQFLEDVRWGDLDYLLIDMPPGTGDISMGLARMLPRAEVLVVTTPPVAAQKVAGRAADMFRRAHVRVAGVIENMTAFECEHGTSYSLFGDGGGDRLAAEIGVPVIGRIPLHPDMVVSADRGEPVAHGDHGPLADAFAQLALRVSKDIAPVVDTASCTARLLDDIERRLGETSPG